MADATAKKVENPKDRSVGQVNEQALRSKIKKRPSLLCSHRLNR